MRFRNIQKKLEKKSVSLTHHSKSKLAEEVSFPNFILTCLNFWIQLFWKLNFITFFTQTSYATLSHETLEITWKNCLVNSFHFSDSSVIFWDFTSEKTNFYKKKLNLGLSLSPLQQSRVELMFYFPFYSYGWNWRRTCPLHMPRNLLFNPSRSWFRIERYGLLAPATGQRITGFRLLRGGT